MTVSLGEFFFLDTVNKYVDMFDVFCPVFPIRTAFESLSNAFKKQLLEGFFNYC
jgi:hypothetical protein